MSAPPDSLLRVGADAMREARYADAIQAFETFCKGAIDRRSKPFFQAQMGLVQAYKHTGQDLHAIALCDQLIKSNLPQVQQWAEAARARLVEHPAHPEGSAPAAPQPTSSPAAQLESQSAAESAPEPESPAAADRPSFLKATTTLLPPEEAADLFGQGRKAMQQGKHEEGIAALEAFIQGTDSTYSNFNWALTSLGKAYRNTERFDKATALQQALAHSPQESLRAWARDFLKTLPQPELAPATEPAPAESPTAAETAAPSATRSVTRATARPSGAALANPRPPAGAARGSRPSSSAVPQQGDLSPQILSALSHGSISLLADLLVGLIFMDSLVAQVLILLRFAIPVVIWLKADNPVVKANAKECVNYILSCLIVGIALGIGAILSIPLMVVALPLVLLLGVAVLLYGLALTIWPIVGTILCARNSDRIFRYPNWLIMHLF